MEGVSSCGKYTTETSSGLSGSVHNTNFGDDSINLGESIK